MAKIAIPNGKSTPNEVAAFLFLRKRQSVQYKNRAAYQCAPTKTQLKTLKRQMTGAYETELSRGTWELLLFNSGEAGSVVFIPENDPTEWGGTSDDADNSSVEIMLWQSVMDGIFAARMQCLNELMAGIITMTDYASLRTAYDLCEISIIRNRAR